MFGKMVIECHSVMMHDGHVCSNGSNIVLHQQQHQKAELWVAAVGAGGYLNKQYSKTEAWVEQQ